MFGEKELPESERVYRSFRRYIALAHLLIPIWFFLAIASYAAAWGPGVGTPLINRSMFILLFVPLAVLIWYFYRTGRERASVGPKLGIPIALIAIVSPFAGLTYFGGDITEYFEFALGFSFSSIVLSWMIVLTPRDYSQEERQEGESGDSDGNRERKT